MSPENKSALYNSNCGKMYIATSALWDGGEAILIKCVGLICCEINLLLLLVLATLTVTPYDVALISDSDPQYTTIPSCITIYNNL